MIAGVGSEWLKFTRKVMPADQLWTAADEQEAFPSWLALPGHMNLGMGRHWHFFSIIFWVLNGVVYVFLLFAIGGWRRLIPTSWSIVPAALQTAWTYAHLQLPPPGHPYNPIQQLAYAGIVFVVAPLMIATGAAMSPAVAARFPGYLRMLGGRQSARSIHFLGLVAICLFTVVHVALVVIEDFPANMSYIIHGQHALEGLSVAIGIGGLIVVVILHVWATQVSLRDPRFVQRALGVAIEPVRRRLLHHVRSRQAYPRSAVICILQGQRAPAGKPRVSADGAGELRKLAARSRRPGRESASISRSRIFARCRRTPRSRCTTVFRDGRASRNGPGSR